MTEPMNFDFAFRPNTYFEPLPPRELTPGEARTRTQILAMLEDGDVKGLADLEGDAMNTFLDLARTERLSEQARKTAGKIHPALMAGQYLPPLEPDEVEIAQICLDSTTGDVISVYARQTPDGIEYRVVDEYADEDDLEDEDDSIYDWSPSSSTEPLTLAEMVTLIESIVRYDDGYDYGKGFIYYIRDSHVSSGSDPEEMVDFVKVVSPFYPELFGYFEQRANEWLQDALANGPD